MLKEHKNHKISGAEAVIRCLLEEDSNIAFGYPGGAIMPIYDEIYKFEKQFRHILGRHEQGAIHSAQGFARVTGRAGIVFATSGPGATNLVTGIADAQIDSTPLICITGQVSSHLLGSDAFQEIDIIGISTPITKWNCQVTKAADIPEVFAKAFYIANSGRPGPVLIDITKDAQFEKFDFSYKKCDKIRSYRHTPKIKEAKIKEAAAVINQAKKPFIVFGQGVILGNAEEEFKTFIEKTGIPAASTLMGLSALPTSHPLYVGRVGMHGNYAPNVLTNDCDVFIGIGMRFDDRVTGNLDSYAKQAKVIHLEIDPAEVDKNVKTDIAVLGNVKETLVKLTEQVTPSSYKEWLGEFDKLYQKELEVVIEPQIKPSKDTLTMAEVFDQINGQTNGDAVIVTDVGQNQMIAWRYADFVKTRSSVTSGGLGTMGFSLPAAIGAKIGVPEREVISIVGDGGFQMTLQELGVIMQHSIPVKVVVLNNEYLGMVRQWQELFFDKRYASTEMSNPDFIKIAEAYGIEAKRVTTREELSKAVKEMIASDKPYFLEVLTEKEGNVFPMVPTGASVSDIRLS